MALTESNKLPLGTTAPNFSLLDTVSGAMISLDDVRGQHGTVVMFICNHCPYVIHVNAGIVALVTKYKAKGVGFVGISSNDVSKYPQDGPELMTQHALEVGYNFPYLFDELQEVAKAYDAACTPDFYIFDSNDVLVYHGQMDGSRPNSEIPVTAETMALALDRCIEGLPPLENQKPSMGCNIKWKASQVTTK